VPEEQLGADKFMVGKGEENEETILTEPLVKLLRFETAEDTGAKGGWIIKGSGELKIQKNKETGKVRCLIRTEMTGRVILNSSIMEG
jgi:hypothetical protein